MAGGEFPKENLSKPPKNCGHGVFKITGPVWEHRGAPLPAEPRFLHHQKSTETAGSGPISFGKHRLIHASLAFQGFCLFLPKTDGNKCGESEVRAALLKKEITAFVMGIKMHVGACAKKIIHPGLINLRFSATAHCLQFCCFVKKIIIIYKIYGYDIIRDIIGIMYCTTAILCVIVFNN